MNKKKSLQAQYREMAKKSQRNMEESIRKHLELNAALDKNFKEAYIPEKFGDCIKFVVECAEDILGGNSGNVDDETCYKMARDFFLDRLWEESDVQDEEVKEAIQAQQAAPEKKEEPKQPVLKAVLKKDKDIVKANSEEKKPERKKLGELDQLDMFAIMGA